MSRRDAVLLVSRAVMLYLILWILSDAVYLPERLFALVHYVRQTNTALANDTYYHYYRKINLMSLVALLTRIVGLSLVARWLYKCGPEVEKLLMPSEQEQAPAPHS